MGCSSSKVAAEPAEPPEYDLLVELESVLGIARHKKHHALLAESVSDDSRYAAASGAGGGAAAGVAAPETLDVEVAEIDEFGMFIVEPSDEPLEKQMAADLKRMSEVFSSQDCFFGFKWREGSVDKELYFQSLDSCKQQTLKALGCKPFNQHWRTAYDGFLDAKELNSIRKLFMGHSDAALRCLARVYHAAVQGKDLQGVETYLDGLLSSTHIPSFLSFSESNFSRRKRGVVGYYSIVMHTIVLLAKSKAFSTDEARGWLKVFLKKYIKHYIYLPRYSYLPSFFPLKNVFHNLLYTLVKSVESCQFCGEGIVDTKEKAQSVLLFYSELYFEVIKPSFMEHVQSAINDKDSFHFSHRSQQLKTEVFEQFFNLPLLASLPSIKEMEKTLESITKAPAKLVDHSEALGYCITAEELDRLSLPLKVKNMFSEIHFSVLKAELMVAISGTKHLLATGEKCFSYKYDFGGVKPFSRFECGYRIGDISQLAGSLLDLLLNAVESGVRCPEITHLLFHFITSSAQPELNPVKSLKLIERLLNLLQVPGFQTTHHILLIKVFVIVRQYCQDSGQKPIDILNYHAKVANTYLESAKGLLESGGGTKGAAVVVENLVNSYLEEVNVKLTEHFNTAFKATTLDGQSSMTGLLWKPHDEKIELGNGKKMSINELHSELVRVRDGKVHELEAPAAALGSDALSAGAAAFLPARAVAAASEPPVPTPVRSPRPGKPAQ